jgi:hypothetical protein
MEYGEVRIEWTGHDGFRPAGVRSRADRLLTAGLPSGEIDCQASLANTAESDTHRLGQALHSQAVALRSPTPGQRNRLHPWQCLGKSGI